MNKLPKSNTYFWIMKLAATTLDETDEGAWRKPKMPRQSRISFSLRKEDFALVTKKGVLASLGIITR